MKNYVVESYENYREEDRLSTDNARRIEFLTTVRILDRLVGEKKSILDCAAGTGIYAFHFADRGHTVTATNLTPRHIEIIRKILKDKPYQMETAVLDALFHLRRNGAAISPASPRSGRSFCAGRSDTAFRRQSQSMERGGI